MDVNFANRGFTKIIPIQFEDELKNLQIKIYDLTKNLLENHDENLDIQDKLKLKFKRKPSNDDWSRLMGEINKSNELKELINCKPVEDAFKIIFDNPKPFEISTFRARFPEQKRVLYNWHQDEGTWYLSKKKEHLNKFPATLWLSLNGANKDESIQLVKYSHKKKLLNHNFVSGQGFFNIDKKNEIDENDIFTVETKASEGVLFHPLTIHRSVPATKINFKPRYTIDIRYYDENFEKKFKVDWKFSVKRILKKIF
tara:strand:+ start:33 stop:797 length:765 start_codon:yes stop_codon:yes gene_type:complete